MAKLADPWGHHDWDSADYVSQWAERQKGREAARQEAFAALAAALPFKKDAAIKILDVGAGYGGLAMYLLARFPNATAVCQDGSQAMAELGAERMKEFAGRFSYVIADFSKRNWSRKITDRFDAAVSSIAIHNVRDTTTIQRIYTEIFPLLKSGGCFLNFDRMRPSLEDQLVYVKEAGFERVKSFWQAGKRAVIGGFKP
ncbi:MAG TPA: class I SAM-dependent methyltransferase [Verrucomicrobiae bacterium]|nr:class I SAM-dependent methyltransferase [Verrucomicrobiae bacterium]